MGEFSKIEWCDHTFNPWYGCQRVSPGCDNCYAESWAKRSGLVQWGPGEQRRRSKTWANPVKWNRQAERTGQRAKVFCASLADVFDNKVPPEWRNDLWKLVRSTTNLDWLILTKRPENIKKFLPDDWENGYSNVWLGTTAEDKERYDHRWRILKDTPAAIHFISQEPSIGPVRLPYVQGRDSYHDRAAHPDWIICGGESGPKARYMEPDWARDLLRDCRDRGIPFFMKQMTGKRPIPDDLMVREFPA